MVPMPCPSLIVALRRIAQGEREGLVGFVEQIADHRDGDGLGQRAGVESQRAGDGGVVAVCRRGIVSRRVLHGDGLTAARAETDREGGIDRCPCRLR